MLRVLNIVGARPNFMKISPIMKAMAKTDFIEPLLLHTGQHYDKIMSDSFFNDLEIPVPDIHLGVGSNTHAKQVANIMQVFDDVCDDVKPDAILVVGDVNSTMACSIVGAKKGIKIVHVEAGIRSFDRTMPEEINRMVTDSITDLFLPPSQDAVQNLLKEGHSESAICMVGNIMIDTLFAYSEKIKQSSVLDSLKLESDNYCSMTLHRPSNVDDPEAFNRILNAIEYIQTRTKVVFPIHPRSLKMIKTFGLESKIQSMERLILTEPMGYFDFSSLIENSKFVLTDSGGIQEETTVKGIPCITLRENTERPITVAEGTNELAGSDTELIKKYVDRILSGNWKKGAIPELWDGNTAERIVEALKTL